MTILVKKEVYPDIFQDNEWPLFSETRASDFVEVVPKLAMVNFFIEQKDEPLALSTFLEQLTHIFFNSKPLSENYKMWVFSAHSSWQQKSVMVMHKKFWRTALGVPFSQFDNKKEFMIEMSKGVRFAGVAEVTSQNLLTAIGIAEGYSGFLFLTPKAFEMNMIALQSLFSAAFSKYKGLEQSTIDLLSLSVHLCPMGNIVLKPVTEHNSRALFLECVMLPKDLVMFM